MRFTVAAAILATGAMAAYVPPVEVSTDYETKMVTITSCGPEVTNCPARSHSATPYTSVPAVTTSEALPVTTDESSPETTSAPLTTSTIYSTKVHTITSCAATVTNCPARSTIVSTETIAVSTTVCPVSEESETPKTPGKTGGENSGVKPSSAVDVPIYTPVPVVPSNGTYGGGSSSGSGSSYAVPQPPTTSSAGSEQCVPSSSVTAITKSYTTVYTSVEYSTIQIPCATETAVVPPASTPVYGGGNNSGNNNGGNTTVPATTPVASTPAQVTGAAGAVTGSAFFAAAAGLAALILA